MKKEYNIQREMISPPGDTLQEILAAYPMSQAELAERIGRPKERVNDIIKGREPITTKTAFQLEKVLGMPASFWIMREQEYRRKLYEIEQKEQLENAVDWLNKFPVKQLKEVGVLSNTSKRHAQVEDLLRFFGIATPMQWSKLYLNPSDSVSFRLSLANTKSPYAISAWLRMGEKEAEKLKLEEYDKSAFKACIYELREVAYLQPKDFTKIVKHRCASVGVAVVFTPNLSKAPISGATRWIYNRPLIQLSGRYKTADHFWFTLFHEAAHILLHSKRDVFLEELEGAPSDKQKELEANQYAEELLLSGELYKRIKDEDPYTDAKILTLSKTFRIHPGSLVGYLQHHNYLSYSSGNQYKVRINLFEK